MSKLPETGPSLVRHLRQQQRRMIRNENSSPFTRSGSGVTAENELTVEGSLRSWDYDGTSRADLGATGWMLGPDDGGPSLLALNGVDVYADLAAKDVTILGLIDDLAATQADLTTAQATLATTVSGLTTAQATLADQVADLASRVTVTTSISTFNTGSLPNDSTFHEYGADIPITIDVPTGRVVVTVGCGEASLNCGGNSVDAEATFSISGGVVPAYGSFVSRAFLQSGAGTWTSNSLSVQRAFVVTPGTYTITGKMRAWASGTATASVNFVQPYLTVQVTG